MPEYFTTDSRVITIGTSPIVHSRSVPTNAVNTPPKVSGAWVTYPDGSRFRKPTAYARNGITYIRQSPEETTGIRNTQPWKVTTGPGGILQPIYGGVFHSGFSLYNLPTLAGPPNLATLDRNEASTKSLNKLADGTAQLGENLATLSQTARMVIDPTRSLLKEIARFRAEKTLWPLARKSYRDLVRGGASEKVAGAYLQYVYGVKPLMQDIHNIMKMAKDAGIKPLFLSSNHTVASSSYVPDKSYVDVSWGRDEYMENIEFASKSRCALWARLNTSWQLTRALNQLGLLNPVSLAWELVPYSFVIDWLIPIGSVLNAYSAPAGLDFVGGSESRTVAIAANIRNQTHAFSGEKINTQSPATAQVFYKGYRRVPLSSWPRPGFYFDMDPLGLSRDGSDRVLKALALATVKLPRL